MNPHMKAVVLRELDRELATMRESPPPPVPAGGWVNAIRRAIGMTERQLAGRVGIAQSSIHSLERSEANGTIRLDTLRRAAEALDCELVYVLVPRVPLHAVVEERAREIARGEIERVRQTMSLEAQDVVFSPESIDERTRDLIARGRIWESR